MRKKGSYVGENAKKPKKGQKAKKKQNFRILIAPPAGAEIFGVFWVLKIAFKIRKIETIYLIK